MNRQTYKSMLGGRKVHLYTIIPSFQGAQCISTYMCNALALAHYAAKRIGIRPLHVAKCTRHTWETEPQECNYDATRCNTSLEARGKLTDYLAESGRRCRKSILGAKRFTSRGW